MQIGTTSSATQAGVTAAGGTATTPDPALAKAAQAFEAIFLRQMIGAMRSSSLAEGMFDSSATEQFRDMADARTADEMARTSKFGIADLLMKQFGPKSPLTPANAAALSASNAATTTHGEQP